MGCISPDFVFQPGSILPHSYNLGSDLPDRPKHRSSVSWRFVFLTNALNSEGYLPAHFPLHFSSLIE